MILNIEADNNEEVYFLLLKNKNNNVADEIIIEHLNDVNKAFEYFFNNYTVAAINLDLRYYGYAVYLKLQKYFKDKGMFADRFPDILYPDYLGKVVINLNE